MVARIHNSIVGSATSRLKLAGGSEACDPSVFCLDERDANASTAIAKQNVYGRADGWLCEGNISGVIASEVILIHGPVKRNYCSGRDAKLKLFAPFDMLINQICFEL